MTCPNSIFYNWTIRIYLFDGFFTELENEYPIVTDKEQKKLLGKFKKDRKMRIEDYKDKLDPAYLKIVKKHQKCYSDMVEGRMFKYTRVLKFVFAVLMQYTSKDTIVAIEGYAFKAPSSSAYTKLMELGGLVRAMCSGFGLTLHELSAKHIKLFFSGLGGAKKEKMYEAYKVWYQLPSLYKALGLKEEKYEKVPAPINDIVDALATALCIAHDVIGPMEKEKEKVIAKTLK